MKGRTNSMLGKAVLYSHYFGDGSDGDFTVPTDETVMLSCAVDQEQIYRQYNNLTIEAGGVLKPANRCNGMVLLINGDLTVNGTISVDKCAPLTNDREDIATNEDHVKLCNLVGGNGGDGGNGVLSSWDSAVANTVLSSGGTGGKGHKLGGGFPGGGGSAVYSVEGDSHDGGDGEPRSPAGITFPYPGTTGAGLYGAGGGATDYAGGDSPGGSGAAVYGDDDTDSAGLDGDGYPGGALFIFVKGNIVIGKTGIISANGGNGASNVASFTYHSGAGGGAGGGIIAIVYNKGYTNYGTIRANGGLAGTLDITQGTSNDGAQGQNGGVGSILVTTLTNLLRSAE